MKSTITIVFFIMQMSIFSTAQMSSNFYRQYLPINTHAQLSYLSPGTSLETILFDAQPIARYHVYNDIMKKNLRVEPVGRAFYISFRPQIRMYNSQSNPVRTPSYKIALGSQWSKLFHKSNTRAHQLAISLESGHYSNGQPNCFLSNQFLDGSSSCDSLYSFIAEGEDITQRVNRSSGNFSTNWTELIFQYKWMKADSENYMENISHALRLGYTHYHNRFIIFGKFGGFSSNDIELYGSHFFHGYYEYYSYFMFNDKPVDFIFIQSFDIVTNADPRISKLRSLSKVVIFPFGSDLGVFGAIINGRDNYNIRFVDDVTQFQIGLTWTGKMKVSLDFDN